MTTTDAGLALALGACAPLTRRARLEMAVVPSLKLLAPLLSDKNDGRLRATSREQAKDAGLPAYTSRSLSVLDKLYEDEDGNLVVVRYTSSARTPGQTSLALHVGASE